MRCIWDEIKSLSTGASSDGFGPRRLIDLSVQASSQFLSSLLVHADGFAPSKRRQRFLESAFRRARGLCRSGIYIFLSVFWVLARRVIFSVAIHVHPHTHRHTCRLCGSWLPWWLSVCDAKAAAWCGSDGESELARTQRGAMAPSHYNTCTHTQLYTLQGCRQGRNQVLCRCSSAFDSSLNRRSGLMSFPSPSLSPVVYSPSFRCVYSLLISAHFKKLHDSPLPTQTLEPSCAVKQHVPAQTSGARSKQTNNPGRRRRRASR